MQEIDRASFVDDVLSQFDRRYEIVDTSSTRNHTIIKAKTGNHGVVCLKINTLVFERPTDNKQPRKYLRYEIELYRLIDGAPWAPKMFATADDYSWMIREWAGENTVEKLRGRSWTKERLLSFWNFSADVFGFFHGLDEPHVIRDFFPLNIGCDDRRFYFFDVNNTKPLEFARNSSRAPRTGSGSSLFMAPEIVQSDFEHLSVNADLFSFASLIYKFLTGNYAWTNSAKDLAASRRQYLLEYRAAAEILDDRLQELGFGQEDRSFVCNCLHPDPLRRPERMQSPSASQS